MISYLIDTDWIIDFLKGKREVVNKLTSLVEEGLAISIISLAELYEGIYAAENPERQMNRSKEKIRNLQLPMTVPFQYF